MKALIPLLLMPFIAMADEVAGHYVKEIKGKIFAVPQTVEFHLKDTASHTSEPCKTGHFTLQSAVSIWTEYNCATDPSNIWCRNILSTVDSFATIDGGTSWGSAKNTFEITLKEKNPEESKYVIARIMKVEPSQVIMIAPDLSSIGPDNWKTATLDQENFYQKIISVFGLKNSIKMDRKGKKIIVDNRLGYCAIKEGGITFGAEGDVTSKIVVAAPEKETKELHGLYENVLADWEKLEEKKWQNSLHKMLYAGTILKARLETGKKETNQLEKYFDKFFEIYHEDDMHSVHINRFRSMNEFTEKVNPPHREDFISTISLKQIGE